MSKKFELPPTEKITKISIPDDEVINWMKTLHEEGFSQEEIDTIMSHANLTYRKKLRPNFIEEELAKIKEEFLKKHGRILTKEQIEYFRKGLEIRLNK